MTPHAYAPPSDNESLQADVMRFMAIIAFCLIAILALVRNVEPAPEAETETAAKREAVPEQQAPAEKRAAAEPEVAAVHQAAAPAAPQPAAPPAPKAPPAPAPREVSTATPSSWRQPLPKAEPAPVKAPRTPKPQPRPQRLEAEDVAAQTTTPPQTSAPTPTADEEEGLSLRFASDGDFLRLIARGDIRVYAFREADVLTLTSAYDFLKARSPGQLYELMPQTIPSMIVDALVRSRRERGDSDSFSWGITLPAAIQQQISGHVARVASGQLVIDRYGDVHHVASR